MRVIIAPPSEVCSERTLQDRRFSIILLTLRVAFLSWLRLATYMAIVAVAILISFHLKTEASALEKRIALPFGLVFWILAIACLAAGLNNYIKTVSRYSRRQALVQSGTGTQLVGEVQVQYSTYPRSLFASEYTDDNTGFHRGCNGYRCCMCVVPLDECWQREVTVRA